MVAGTEFLHWRALQSAHGLNMKSIRVFSKVFRLPLCACISVYASTITTEDYRLFYAYFHPDSKSGYIIFMRDGSGFSFTTQAGGGRLSLSYCASLQIRCNL